MFSDKINTCFKVIDVYNNACSMMGVERSQNGIIPSCKDCSLPMQS